MSFKIAFSSVSALSDSLNDDEERTRVCNPGKVQRLTLAALQGRLAGVNIDRVPTPVGTFVSLFFMNPAIAQIETRAALLEAANDHINNNPLIPREPFLTAIRNYANLQGLN